VSVFLDDRPKPVRSLSRFLAFALVVIIGVSGLTARLFYLQIVDGGRLATLSARNRTVLDAIRSPRGVIYDRAGRVLVTNVPTYVVKLRPSDLPLDQRPVVVDRLAALLGMSAADINANIDGNPGSTFDLVRIAGDVEERTARLISEAGADLPGVEVAVEARRQYAYGPLMSQILGYTGPVSGDQLGTLKAVGYLPDDLIGKGGIEAEYETQLRGVYGSESVERDASGRRMQVLQTISAPRPGDSLTLTIDTKEQQYAQKAMLWAMKVVGIKRGVVIVMNPQTGEVIALVSLPTYDNNAFARGISNADYAKLLNNPDKPLLNHAVQAHYPPGSTYKLVAGTGVLADKKITSTTKVATKGYLTLGSTRFYDWNHRGFGACDIYCGFGHSSDTFFFQMAGKLGIDRLGYWAKQYGFGQPTGIDLPGEVPGIVPTNQWKQDVLGSKIFPGETYQAGIGQGYDVVTPIQLINAYAARSTSRRSCARSWVPMGRSSAHSRPRSCTSWPCPPACSGRCATPHEIPSPSGTRTTSSICRSRSPESRVPPSSAPVTARAACRSTRGSSDSSRRTSATDPSTGRTRNSSSSRSPTIRAPRATSRPRS
jgi:penicillin-binding protein 2